ncbi:MAG: zinc-binding dehydrogenase [Paracoccaceae bacterium]|nr:zinc-binding dehydrogenase [Paracoccaceae bacterium]
MALGSIGGFVSHVMVPVSNLVPMPDTMRFDEAACFTFACSTSRYALHDWAKLRAGETLLVLGAASGVGAATVELGKVMEAKVVVAASSGNKAAFCRKIDAGSKVIYPRDMDLKAQKVLSVTIKALAGPGGVDVVYDAASGAYSEAAVRCLGWEGLFLVVGFPVGVPKVPLTLALLKSCQIRGAVWGAFTTRDPQIHQGYLADL